MRLDADKISVGTWSSRITGQSTEQQKVETQVIESKNVIVIQQANPQVIYVPSYDPVVVWGPLGILPFTTPRDTMLPGWRFPSAWAQ